MTRAVEEEAASVFPATTPPTNGEAMLGDTERELFPVLLALRLFPLRFELCFDAEVDLEVAPEVVEI